MGLPFILGISSYLILICCITIWLNNYHHYKQQCSNEDSTEKNDEEAYLIQIENQTVKTKHEVSSTNEPAIFTTNHQSMPASNESEVVK